MHSTRPHVKRTYGTKRSIVATQSDQQGVDTTTTLSSGSTSTSISAPSPGLESSDFENRFASEYTSTDGTSATSSGCLASPASLPRKRTKTDLPSVAEAERRPAAGPSSPLSSDCTTSSAPKRLPRTSFSSSPNRPSAACRSLVSTPPTSPDAATIAAAEEAGAGTCRPTDSTVAEESRGYGIRRHVLASRKAPQDRIGQQEKSALLGKSYQSGTRTVLRQGGRKTGKAAQSVDKSRRLVIQPRLEQTRLNLSSKSVSKSCSSCGMSYVKTSPEDVALHARYCRAMAAGIEWPFSGDGLAIAPKIHGLRETLRVLEKDIKLVGGNRLSVCGQVIAVPGCAKGAMGRKLKEVADTVDRALNAASLTDDELAKSSFFLFISMESARNVQKDRVLGCAIVTRIKDAYRIVQEPTDCDGKAHLDFGDSGNGSVLCSQTPSPAMLGVHRIWTSPAYRQLGMASVLLHAVAQYSIYGVVITKDGSPSFRDSIAFSQPSSAGQRLFTAFTGTPKFLVFVE